MCQELCVVLVLVLGAVQVGRRTSSRTSIFCRPVRNKRRAISSLQALVYCRHVLDPGGWKRLLAPQLSLRSAHSAPEGESILEDFAMLPVAKLHSWQGPAKGIGCKGCGLLPQLGRQFLAADTEGAVPRVGSRHASSWWVKVTADEWPKRLAD